MRNYHPYIAETSLAKLAMTNFRACCENATSEPMRELIAYLFLTLSTAAQPLVCLAADTQGAPTGNWRLLRTANPKGGPDAVSMSHTADMARSDLDLAGIMLKCGEHGVEVVVVALTPLPPRARPEIMISALGKEWRFVASVVPPGAELLLPADAMHLAAGLWQSAHELSVQVKSEEQSFAGVVPIDGIAAALATLTTNCPQH
jgi:hypothetical protein